ncbi:MULTISPECIES: hypothetical protein [Bizionia]|uniref:Uncharacterized protein n=1 Tax=Bizionia algoritergicola TaxID=291187 RepID=A0A5D0QN49_9FLAO|nr:MULTISPECIES: hypothetical protein [Bizionia]OBX18718.1 hypothetical protein BAA08_15330 [Bizionia sp. APA-3]TYB70642.1 hypothetical protein ES675_15845 [Bizionia algoritergicola]
MRKNLFVLASFVLVLVTVFSCDDDDNLNNGNDNQIVLTTENNLYEGDLYALYLEKEVSNTQNTIALLQDIIDAGQGTPEIELQLDEAEQQLEIQNSNLAIQMGVEAEYVLPPRVPRRPPNPPNPPSPCQGTCFPLDGGFNFITITPDIASVNIRFLDYNTEDEIETVMFNNFSPSENYNGVVSIQPGSLNKFTGQVIIIVERENVNGATASYSLNARFY